MKAPFQTVDVFTDRQFGGNPVAVILDARGLSDVQMQAIANEFNLAETTFVLPPDDPVSTARVRIFTPRAEMRLRAIRTLALRLSWRTRTQFAVPVLIAET